MTPPADIVLVTVDSLRADHCSYTGYQPETTPELDALASEGTVFENAIAPGPSTPESMPAVFTGHRMHESSSEAEVESMRSTIRRHLAVRETIPERLSRRGYSTAGFTPNPFTSRFFGFDAGFDRFEDFMGSAVRRRYGRFVEQFVGNTAVGPVARLLANLLFRQEAFKPWEAYYDSLLAWVEEAHRPYFLWVHLMDPHVPYLPPRGYRSQPWWAIYHANYRFWRQDKESTFAPEYHERLVRAYDDAVRFADAFLTRLRADLDTAPVFVVHGDHGEAFGEHGSYGHEPHLYEENIHVPLVVSGQPDERVQQPTSLVQLPRILEAIAEEEPLDLDGNPFAVSRTHRGTGTALRGEVTKYISEGAAEHLFDLRNNERDRVVDDDLMEICRNRRRRIEASETERRLIRDAVMELV